jgi:hypothetical protein
MTSPPVSHHPVHIRVQIEIGHQRADLAHERDGGSLSPGDTEPPRWRESQPSIRAAARIRSTISCERRWTGRRRRARVTARAAGHRT